MFDGGYQYMENLPLFPMKLVAFPEEELNLHIVEPRYRQLISDCLSNKSTFGIPSYVMNKIEIGTEVAITEVFKVYEDGRMDIRTRGIQAFVVKAFQNPLEEKLYAGGQVEYIQTMDDADPLLNVEICNLATELFEWLQIQKDVVLNSETILYDIIHKIGLQPDEEYLILAMNSMVAQQQYVINHLTKLLPALRRIEAARERIRMNGHFENLDPLDF